MNFWNALSLICNLLVLVWLASHNDRLNRLAANIRDVELESLQRNRRRVDDISNLLSVVREAEVKAEKASNECKSAAMQVVNQANRIERTIQLQEQRQRKAARR